MTRQSAWTRVRPLVGPACGVALIGLLLARVGAEPFLRGLRVAGPGAVLAALAITALTTACCAWRWRVVAAGLGVPVAGSTSFAAYYRSQFLNASLPGGVLGDVDRAVGQGRRAGRMAPGLRSVAWERSLGQVVQLALTAALLIAMPSPLRPAGPLAAVLGVAVLAGAALLVRLLSRRAVGRAGRAARALTDDARHLLRDGRWLPVLASSAVAAAGHVAIFLIAVAASGVPASPTRMLPVACVVLLAASVPANLAGWGPREGAAAWAFGAVGLSASDGVTVAVGYGVLAFVATLPGLLVLLAGRRTPTPASGRPRVREAVDA